MNVSPLKQPSAWVPVAMSVAALAVVLGHIAIFGAVREADEGTAAHLWQILMAGQVPAVAYSSLKWLRRAPGQAQRFLDIVRECLRIERGRQVNGRRHFPARKLRPFGRAT